MSGLQFRSVQPQEYTAAAEVAVQAYGQAGLIRPGDSYADFLNDVAARMDDPLAEVLVALDGDEVVATATMCPFGSPLTVVCFEGEVEPRAVGVRPDRQRQGIAEKLIAACVDWARDHGYHTVTICVAIANTTGHRFYQKLGFVRREDRDWTTTDGTRLLTYIYPVPPSQKAGDQ